MDGVDERVCQPEIYILKTARFGEITETGMKNHQAARYFGFRLRVVRVFEKCPAAVEIDELGVRFADCPVVLGYERQRSRLFVGTQIFAAGDAVGIPEVAQSVGMEILQMGRFPFYYGVVE